MLKLNYKIEVLMIPVFLPLFLHKQPQNLPSETLGMGKKKKAMRFQRYYQEQENLQPQSLRAKKEV